MTEPQSQMGIFPALLEPARAVARELLAQAATQGDIPENPGFVVATDEKLVGGTTLTTFEEEGQTFYLIQL